MKEWYLQTGKIKATRPKRRKQIIQYSYLQKLRGVCLLGLAWARTKPSSSLNSLLQMLMLIWPWSKMTLFLVVQITNLGERHYRNGKLPISTKKGSFWWRDTFGFLDLFKGMSSLIVSIGSTCLLWYDLFWQHLSPSFSRIVFVGKEQGYHSPAGSTPVISDLFLHPLSSLITNFNSLSAFWLLYLIL